MRQNSIFKLIVGTLLLLTINCDYTLNDVLDAATRVKNYVLKYKDIPKIVKVASNEVSMAQFTYAMGVAIKNIHDNKKENKISTIKLEAPTSRHACNKKVDLKDYIDAISVLSTKVFVGKIFTTLNMRVLFNKMLIELLITAKIMVLHQLM